MFARLTVRNLCCCRLVATAGVTFTKYPIFASNGTGWGVTSEAVPNDNLIFQILKHFLLTEG